MSEDFGIWGGLRPTDRRQLRALAVAMGECWPPETADDLGGLVEHLELARELLGGSEQLGFDFGEEWDEWSEDDDMAPSKPVQPGLDHRPGPTFTDVSLF